MIGVIVLMGLVSGILLIDYTNTLRQRIGREWRSARRDRLRPILMTTVALVAA
jgi:multidrug efflux pump subunit AcrB